MFEGTLEAQGLHAGNRRVGTLSAVAALYAALVLALLAASFIWVPMPQVPGPRPVIYIPPARLSIDLTTPHNPRSGGGGARPARPVEPRPPVRPPTEIVPLPPVDTPAPPEDVGIGPDTSSDDFGDGSGRGGGTGLDDGDGNGEGLGEGGDDGPQLLTPSMERPVLLTKVEPEYPSAPRRARMNGRVVLQAVIGLDGAVESVEVLSSTSPLFDDAARDAVRRWRYRPASMGGRPVRIYFTVVVEFVVR